MIIPVKRGEENTDYVNASFIDVSGKAPFIFFFSSYSALHQLMSCLFFALFNFFLFGVQGYRQKDSYMASQGPLQHTIEDFWRMIWEWRSCSIVMLTELEERGQVGA